MFLTACLSAIQAPFWFFSELRGGAPRPNGGALPAPVLELEAAAED
jgi:hypothetical protein